MVCVQVVEGAEVIETNTRGDVIRVRVDEAAEVAKDDEGAELAKEVGPAEGPRTMEETVMAKQDRFDHGGEGGITKSAIAAPFFLVANAGQLRPCDVYQAHFASSA